MDTGETPWRTDGEGDEVGMSTLASSSQVGNINIY